MKFYDTNALLEFGERAYKEPFAISQQTLIEIENIKTGRNRDESTRHKARKAARLLMQHPDMYRVVVTDGRITSCLVEHRLPETPDNIICAAASLCEGVRFVTNDVNCMNLAREVFNLEVETAYAGEDGVYHGYQLLKGNTAEINEAMGSPDFMSGFSHNEYLLTYNTDTDSEGEMRFDGSRFIGLKLPPSKVIKAKNSLQRCALDLLNNPDITIAAVIGGYGSGKSFLSTKMAIHAVRDKGWQGRVLLTRSPVGEGKEVGYLSGDFEEKVAPFFLPVEQQLDGGYFELASLKQQGVIEANIPFYMKGTTYNSTVILVEEAEDLTEKEIKLIGTRLGEGSRIFLNGDYKQAVVDATENNPLIAMCHELKGNPLFGCVYLGEDVRSEGSKLFANLFQK